MTKQLFKFLFKYLCFCSVVLLSACGGQSKKDEMPVEPARATATSSSAQALSTEQKQTLNDAVELIQLGYLDKARKQLLSLAKQSDNQQIALNLAIVEYKAENYDAAQKYVNKAGASAAALNLSGMLALQKQELSLAASQFEQAIKSDASYALAYHNLALIYDTYYQDLGQAIKLYQRYLELSAHEDAQTKAWVEELKRANADTQ
ncbi:hypothetical protein [Agaribacterium haliotis]|uniref:hypothetical protein n=1 Tax=Agaribacterium haliotis TaxID=2013869 RepID=UPI000BB57E05|nr:hypothetical protein [Agaribacterium haliotis]